MIQKKYTAVIDGVELQPFDSLHKVGRALNADGSRFAYGIWINRNSFDSDLYLAINNDRYGPYQGIDPGVPQFFDFNDKITCAVKKSDAWYAKIGDDEFPVESKQTAAEMVWAALGDYYVPISGESL